MSSDEQKKQEAVERGADLLLPLNLEPRQVQAFEFAVDKFRSAAAAKSWAKNHGFSPSETPRQFRKSICLRVRAEEEFEDGTLQRSRLTRDVFVTAGEPLSREVPVQRAVPAADASNEEKREAQAARSERWGIEALEGKGENLSFPADGPTSEEDYADPVNLKYPVETEARAANARVRFKQNADVYEEEKSKAVIHERIIRAELSFGIDPSFDPGDPLDALLPADLKDQISKTVKFAKRGELIVRKANEGDPEESVRMFGIVMKPEVPDSDGIVTSKEEIESANLGFMKDFGITGFMHKKDISEQVSIIQNVIAPIDFEFPLPDGTTKAISAGTWYQELYSEAPEIVERVKVKKTLNGLSIGGFAQTEEITEAAEGGGFTLRPDLPYSETQKRALLEHINRAEGDPTLGRFHNLRVQEVSLVDAAANEEDFFIVKRRKDMGTEKTQPAADPKTGGVAPEEKQQQNEPSTPEPEAPPAAPEVTPESKSIAEQVAEGVSAGIKAAMESGTLASAEKSGGSEAPTAAPETPEEGRESEVKKGMSEISEALKGINQRLDAQEETLKTVTNVQASAKGQVPDGSTTPEQPEEKPTSKWAGTAVSRVFSKK